MKALILNSGIGKRMGKLTENQPKCMTMLSESESILSRQLKQLSDAGVCEVIVTTGPFADKLKTCCMRQQLPLQFKFVHNSLFRETNYIYSIYLARELLESDIILMHGDLVFDEAILRDMIEYKKSCMAVSSAMPLPEKDFKAVIENGRIKKIGVNFFQDSLAAQPLYKIRQSEWKKWLSGITSFCESGRRDCYAEEAFNTISHEMELKAFDVKNQLCQEVDTLQDLEDVKKRIRL